MLKDATTSYTPEYVAQRAGVEKDQLVAAARLYARGRRGAVSCGTGPSMSGHGTLVEYLGRVLMSLCGHWVRAGEATRHPGLIFRYGEAVAGTRGPYPGWGFGEKLRIRGFTSTVAGLPATALSDEILTPGEGKIRALIVVGGNPMVAVPNQLKTAAAMKDLELLVCIDPQLSATARMAHYVIAPTLPLETEGVTVATEGMTAMQITSGFGSDHAYAQYTPVLMNPPPGADVREEWEFFYDLARQLGRQLQLKPISILDPALATERAVPLDMHNRPGSDTIWSGLLKEAAVPYEEIKRSGRAGRVFDIPPAIARAKPEDWDARLDLANATMLAELREVAAEDFLTKQAGRSFRLTVRRVREFHNSAWIDQVSHRAGRGYNPAYMNPADMAALQLSERDAIEIQSDRASIFAVVAPDPDLRLGCIAMTPCWGPNPQEDQNPLFAGSAAARLIDDEKDFDPYCGMPIMSAIPIDVCKREAPLTN